MPLYPNRHIPIDDKGHLAYTFDFEEDVLKVALLVWNPLASPNPDWERMKQPNIEHSGDLTVTMGDVEKLLASNYWKDKQYEYDESGNCIYKGFHTTVNAGADTAGRYIWKYTYDVNGYSTRVQGPLIGTWTNKANLGW